MNKTPAYYIFLGLLIGTLVGLGLGALNGNAVRGMELGALTGTFIGWVMTSPALQR
jgi:hypothetical protein